MDVSNKLAEIVEGFRYCVRVLEMTGVSDIVKQRAKEMMTRWAKLPFGADAKKTLDDNPERIEQEIGKKIEDDPQALQEIAEQIKTLYQAMADDANCNIILNAKNVTNIAKIEGGATFNF